MLPAPSETPAKACRDAHHPASGLTLLGTLLCGSKACGQLSSTAGPAVLWMHSTSLCSLGSHEVLVLQRRALEVDHSLRPQRDLQDPSHLDVHLCRAKYHHVVILEEREARVGQQAGGPTQTCRSELRNGVLLPERTAPLGLLIVVTMCDTPCPCSTALARVLENASAASPRCSA